jgi:hypothetical protein
MSNNRQLPPISRDAIIRKWPLYESIVKDRLCTGARQYGDSSFNKSPNQLLDEISQELMDVTGWAFITWCVIQEMKEKLINGDRHECRGL